MTTPKRAAFKDRLYNVGIRISGEQKNIIIDHAASKGISVAQLIEYAVWEFIRQDKGIPNPGPSQFRQATPQDELRAYLSGETILQPCGQKQCDQQLTKFQGLTFCNTCNLRIA